MIVFNVGTPGSGKSYDAILKIIANLRRGRMVCTNIDGMDSQECQQYLRDYLKMDDFDFHRLFRYLTKAEVMRFWKTEPKTRLVFAADGDGIFEEVNENYSELICPVGSLIIIDEVHKYFNSRDWQNTESKELGDWASTHRHLGYDLVLITQSIDKVDKQVRTLTEWTYFFRKVNFLGSLVAKKYIKYSYSGDDHDGKALCKNVGTYSPEVFPCYSSYAATDAKEVGFMTHVNVLKHPVFLAIPVVICFCLYMFFEKSSFASGDIFGTGKNQKRHDALIKKLAAPASPSALAFTKTVVPVPAVSAVPGTNLVKPVMSNNSSLAVLPVRTPLSIIPLAVASPVPAPPSVVGFIGDVTGTNKKYLLSSGAIVKCKRQLNLGDIYIK